MAGDDRATLNQSVHEKVLGLMVEDPTAEIMIGRDRVKVSDVMGAFGGTLNPGAAAPSTHRFANPSPLGLCGFAMTTFVLSIINFKGLGVDVPQLVVCLAFFYGGFIQLLAGMWEMAVENTFAATALSSYGGFWLSYGAILTPWFNVADSYTDSGMLSKAIGFYLLAWCIFTFGLTACTMKSTVAFFAMFFLLSITFLMLALGEFTGKTGCTTAGGILGLIVAILAWYNAFAGVATKENSYITVRPIYMPGAYRPGK